MATREIRDMPADELYVRWQDDIETIKNSTVHLFTSRVRFRDIARWSRENPAFRNEPESASDVFDWLTLLWGHDALLAIRRELDETPTTICLKQMLHEMEARADVLTRRRYLAHIQPTDSPRIREFMNRDFDRWGAVRPLGAGDPLDDQLDPHLIRADRESLESGTAEAVEYANRIVAHRTRFAELQITLDRIHAAVDAIEPVMKKYYCLLTASSLVTSEATFQFDWAAIFDVPWRFLSGAG